MIKSIIIERIEQTNIILRGLIKAIQKVIEHNGRTIKRMREGDDGKH